MNEGLEYRYLRPTDYDEIIRVWQEANLGYRPHGRDSRERVTAELRRSPRLSIGTFLDGRLVGTVIGTFDGRRGCINRVAVVPEVRGRGVARELIARCEKELREAGALVLFCLIESENQASLQLFERVGYSRADNIIYLSKRDRPDL